MCVALLVLVFFFNDTATTEIYTLSLHDALPIYPDHRVDRVAEGGPRDDAGNQKCGRGFRLRRAVQRNAGEHETKRSEEHTSELQSQSNLVCRLLLEKKKKKNAYTQQNNNKHTQK